MNNAILEYVDIIYTANKVKLDDGGPEVLANFLFGFLEEIEEFHEAKDPIEALNELGDVLAYTTLLLLSCSSVKVTSAILTSFDYIDQPVNSLELLSNFKRFFRGDEALNMDNILNKFFELLEYDKDYTLEAAALVNSEKILRRVQNNTLFSGRGSNR